MRMFLSSGFERINYAEHGSSLQGTLVLIVINRVKVHVESWKQNYLSANHQ